MAYKTIANILEHTHDLRRRVANRLRFVRPTTSDDILAELLSRLERHDRRTCQLMTAHRATASPEVLGTWVQYDDTRSLAVEVDNLGPKGSDPGEFPQLAIDESLELDQRVADIYRSMREQVVAPSVRDFLEELLMIEEQQARLKSRDTLAAQDLEEI